MLLAKIQKAQALFSNPVLDKAAILKYMAKYPVHPPNGMIRPGHFAPKMPVLLGSKAPSADERGHVKFTKQKLVNLVDRVAFARCIEENSPGEKGALSFEMKYADELTSAPSRAGYAPVWWLPWNGSGALVKLTIEPSTTANLNFGGAIAGTPNPNLFFTAAINGCSVFAYGDADSPSIYHAGLTGDVVKSIGTGNQPVLGTTSEEIWANLLNHMHFEGGVGNDNIIRSMGGHRKQDKANFSEINKNDYVAERKGGSYYQVKDFVSGTRGNTTQRARDFQNWMEKHPPNGTLRVSSVSPWGCIFGIRTGNAWEMWLQRNATVIHATARKAHSLGKLKWGKLVPVGAPLFSVVTLGLQKFFPASQAVHYRSFDQINLI